MLQILMLAGLALPIMVILDLSWVGLVANQYYRSQLGSLFAPHITVWPVIVFYALYCLAIGFFVLLPAVEAHSFMRALLAGAFLGLVAYGTYDLINLSITNGWPLGMSLVDMAWGMVVTAAASSGAYLLATKVFGF